MITIKDLTFGYKRSGENVFNNFNLEMHDNCIYGLLGKNATGKSTLLNLISGLLLPKSGSVCIDGLPSGEKSKALLEKLYLVPEEFMLPNWSLKKYIDIYRPFYKDFSQDILDSCLCEFELPTDMKLSKLSMGTKKKVMMSFALATNTKVLLMDEPTNGLDIPSKRQFRKVIASNMTEGRTIVISTHQVHDVETLLDHVAIIGGNGVLLDASTTELADKYTFGTNPQGEILYSEKSLDGEICMARRTPDEDETPVNLELLFEYVNAKR